jgi:hypothetical protein
MCASTCERRYALPAGSSPDFGEEVPGGTGGVSHFLFSSEMPALVIVSRTPVASFFIEILLSANYGLAYSMLRPDMTGGIITTGEPHAA